MAKFIEQQLQDLEKSLVGLREQGDNRHSHIQYDLTTIRNQLRCIKNTVETLLAQEQTKDPLIDTPGLDSPRCGEAWSKAEEQTIIDNFKVFTAATARYHGRSNYAVFCRFKQLWKEGRIN